MSRASKPAIKRAVSSVGDLCSARQHDEIESMRAMYESDMVIMSDQPHCFRLRLDGHLRADLCHVSAYLLVTLPSHYPMREAPTLRIEKIRGLSASQVQALQVIVEAEARTLVGNEMLYEVVTSALDHNQKSLSLIEERQLRLRLEHAASAEKLSVQQAAVRETERLEEDALEQRIKTELAKQNQVSLETATVFAAHPVPFTGAIPKLSPPLGPVQRLTSDPFSLERGSSDEREIDSVTQRLLGASTLSNCALAAPVSNSRYASDFEELDFLGAGGFGEVVSARNRLDGLVYAIKIVKLKNNRPKTKTEILKEVTTLARFNHPNIVRYFNAWIESVVEEPALIAQNIHSISPGQADRPALRMQRASSVSVTEELSQTEMDDWFNNDDTSARYGDIQSDIDEFDEDNDQFSDEEVDPREVRDSFSEHDEPGVGGDGTTAAKTRVPETSKTTPIKPKREHSYSLLYIVMEYCSKRTLRDLIDNNTLIKAPVELTWTLVRQLLEALDYIHKQHFVHRDVKPLNIFIDGEETTVKLGDFGLAVVHSGGATATAGSGARVAISEQSYHDCVGTPFYRAPEQEVAGQAYSSKADMFAVGMLVFEMWTPPFATTMERSHYLTALRTTGDVPLEIRQQWRLRLGNEPADNCIDFVQQLLRPDPKQRPNAIDMLNSGLLPQSDLEKYIAVAIKTVEMKDPTHSRSLRDAMFSVRPSDTFEFTFDGQLGAAGVNSRKTGKSTTTSAAASISDSSGPQTRVYQQRTRMQLADRCQRVFRRHGGVTLDLPLFLPRSKQTLDQVPDSSVSVMDEDGNLAFLPYSPLLPFARHCSQRGITSLRRYSFAQTYRRMQRAAQPRTSVDCTFDIISERGQEPLERAFVAAESVLILREIFDDLQPVLGHQHILRINHLSLMNACFAAVYDLGTAGFGQSVVAGAVTTVEAGLLNKHQVLRVRAQVYHLFGRSSRPAWSLLRHMLMTGECSFGARQVDLLEQLVGEPGPVSVVLERMHARFPGDVKVQNAIEEFEQHSDQLVFAVGLLNRDSRPSQQHSLTFDAFAFGGGYDALLDRYRPPNAAVAKISGVGFTLLFDRIVGLALAADVNASDISLGGGRGPAGSVGSAKIQPGLFLGSTVNGPSSDTSIRPGVMLYGPGGSMLQERAAIAAQLWRDDVRAELFLGSEEHIDLFEHCRLLSCRFLVSFRKQAFLKSGVVLLRSLQETRGGAAAEEEVHIRDLSGMLLQRTKQQYSTTSGGLLGSQSPVIKPTGSATTHALAALADFSLSSSSQSKDKELDCVILETVPLMKSKEKQRISLLAAKQVHPLLSAVPHRHALAAIDLPLVLIRDTCTAVYEDLSKHSNIKVIELVRAQPGKSVGLVEKLLAFLKKMISKQIEYVFLYSIADRRCDIFMVNS